MKLLSSAYWPLWVATAVMVAAAVINLGTGCRLPNWLTFPFVVAGVVLGLFHSIGITTNAGYGGLGAALTCCLLMGFVILLPVYVNGGIGAGTLKLQMGWCAWLGAFYGMGVGIELASWSLLLAAIGFGVTALILRTNSTNPFALRLLPTGPAQAAGAIGVVLGAEVFGWVPLICGG